MGGVGAEMVLLCTTLVRGDTPVPPSVSKVTVYVFTLKITFLLATLESIESGLIPIAFMVIVSPSGLVVVSLNGPVYFSEPASGVVPSSV